MAVTAYKSPGTITEDTTSGTQPISSYASLAGSGATISWATGSPTSYRYKLTNFGFTTSDLPTGATIDGFEIAYTRNENSATDNLNTANVQLIKADGSLTGTNVAVTTEWPTTSGERVLGSSTNLMGYTGATGANIHDVDFGFAYQAASASGTTPAGSLGWMKIRVYYTVGSTYTLTAAQGSFSESGQAAILKRGLILPSGQGGFSETGQAATLKHGYLITAAQGSFTHNGQTSILLKQSVLTAAYGSFSTNGQSALLEYGRIFVSNYGAFALSGQAATLNRVKSLQSDVGAFSDTGQSASLLHNRLTSAAYGAFTLSGQDASLRQFKLIATYGSYTLAGYAATLSKSTSLTIAAGVGTFTHTGQDAGLYKNYPLTAAHSTLSLTGQASILLYGRAVSAAHSAFTLSGQNATIQHTWGVTASHGAFTATGQTAALLYGHTTSASNGAFTLSGQAANLIVPASLSAGSGTFTLSGQDSQLLYGGFGRKYLVVANETAWIELIRRVNTQLGYPGPSVKTTRQCYKMTHADGRRALVMEQVHYPDIIGCLTSPEMAALTTTSPAGFSYTTTAPTGEFPYTASVAIVCEGDSIITGDYNLDGGVGWLAESEKFYYQLMVALGSPSNVTAVNLGVGGSKFADLAARQAANIDNLNWPVGCEKVMCLMVGSNDIHHDGMTPANAYAALKSRIAAYKAETPDLKIIPLTNIARDGSTTNQLAYRDLVLAGHASNDLGSDGVANTGGLSMFDDAADPFNLTYYVDDNDHPDKPGIVAMAECVAPVIQAVCVGV